MSEVNHNDRAPEVAARDLAAVGLSATTLVVALLYACGAAYWTAFYANFGLTPRRGGIQVAEMLYPQEGVLTALSNAIILFLVLRENWRPSVAVDEKPSALVGITKLIVLILIAADVGFMLWKGNYWGLAPAAAGCFCAFVLAIAWCKPMDVGFRAALTILALFLLVIWSNVAGALAAREHKHLTRVSITMRENATRETLLVTTDENGVIVCDDPKLRKSELIPHERIVGMHFFASRKK